MIGIIDSYQSFNDPEEPISQEITRITGITDEDVEGHSLNWGIISQIMEPQIGLARNNS